MKMRIAASSGTVETSTKTVHALRSWSERNGDRRGVLSAGEASAALRWKVGSLAACSEAHDAVRAAILARGGEVLDLRDVQGQRLTVDVAAIKMRHVAENGTMRVHYRSELAATNVLLDRPMEVHHD